MKLLLSSIVILLATIALFTLWRPSRPAQASSFQRKPVTVLDDEPPTLGRLPVQPAPRHTEGRQRTTGNRGDLLACIRDIESSNNYSAVSPTGKYRGAYQASTSFWLRHGGDPAYAGRHELAPPEMQDAVALRGLRDQGLGSWPTPNRKCR